MKEIRKLKILTKAEGKYRTYTLDQLTNESKLLEAKHKDITRRIINLENKIDEWENNEFTADSLDGIKPSVIIAGTTIALAGATAAAVCLATQSQGQTFAAFAISSIPYAVAGIGNVAANVRKPVSLPIARAYDSFLGDKIEILNKKKLMVDELIEARVLNKLKGADSAAFDNDPSLTQEQVEFMK